MPYLVRATLDLSGVQELDRQEPLQAAVVRQGRVLGGQRIDLAGVRNLGRVPVEIAIDLPPQESAEGIELRIGPVAPDRVLTAYEAFVVTPPADALAKLREGGTLDLGTHKILDAVYRLWRVRCRRYHVHGRLVRRVPLPSGVGFCDQPVPGATVELYDVDRVCCWFRKDLITTAVTDADGRFDVHFRWCCSPWLFFPYDGWIVAPELWERLRDLLRRLRRVAPPLDLPGPLPDPPDPITLTRFFERLDQVAPPDRFDPATTETWGAPVRLAAAASLGEPGAALSPAPPPASLQLSPEARRVIGEIRLLCPVWTWRRYADCLPDLLIRATQAVGGGLRVVYEEDYADTRWNLPATPELEVLLLANEQAVAVNTCVPATPPGDCLWFSGVGAIQIQEIGSVAAGGVLAGYHHRITAMPGARPDAPFGGTVRLNGLFGQATANVDYYKLQVAPWNGNPATLPVDTDFHDVPAAYLGAVYKSYLGVDPAAPLVPKPVEVVLGPTSIGPTSGLYRSMESVRREYEAAHGGHAPGPWGWLWAGHEWLATIATGYLPNGLVVFRLVGYTLAGGGLVNARLMRQCTPAGVAGPVELLPLRLDNRRLTVPPTGSPDVEITGIAVNGTPIANFVCRDLELRSGDQVTVNFKASDPLAHLSTFNLAALYRIGCSHGLTEPPQFTTANTYGEALAAGAVRPAWAGGTYSVTLTVAAHNATASCAECGLATAFFQFSGAYNLRLAVWKRTTNGFGPIHYAETNATIVVRRLD